MKAGYRWLSWGVAPLPEGKSQGLYLVHTASDQKLDGGKAWEQGYIWCSYVQNTGKEELHRVLTISGEHKRSCFSHGETSAAS